VARPGKSGQLDGSREGPALDDAQAIPIAGVGMRMHRGGQRVPAPREQHRDAEERADTHPAHPCPRHMKRA
jgi:hypothetical protein